jgi:hypothetical protein
MALKDMGMKIESEQLGYWFLRLNGFLTTVNFVVHPEVGRDQRTDVDILGVRFPWRREGIEDSMEDSPTFTGVLDRPLFVISEAKTGLCDLNGPWSQPERRNMQQVLAAIGCCPLEDVDSVARTLHESGCVSGSGYFVSLLCLGGARNPEILRRYPAVPQVTWGEALRFVHSRFWKYQSRKVSHQQWDRTGHKLWKAVESSRGDPEAFVGSIEVVAPARAGAPKGG